MIAEAWLVFERKEFSSYICIFIFILYARELVHRGGEGGERGKFIVGIVI